MPPEENKPELRLLQGKQKLIYEFNNVVNAYYPHMFEKHRPGLLAQHSRYLERHEKLMK